MKKAIWVSFVLSIVLLLASCANEVANAASNVFTESDAMTISKVTSGRVAPSESITVEFVADQDVKTGDVLKSKVFTFEPDISGRAVWKDKKTLVFTPDRDLKYKTKYSASLDLLKLLGKSPNGLDSFNFSFETTGVELIDFSGDLKMVGDDIVLAGKFKLNILGDEGKVKSSFEVLENGTKIKSEVSLYRDGYYHFESRKLTRGSSEREYKVLIHEDELELPYKYSYRFILPADKELGCEGAYVSKAAGNKEVVLYFTEELLKDQFVKDKIAIDPKVPIETKIKGKKIYLNGIFEYGKSYKISVFSGIKGALGNELKSDKTFEVTFYDMESKIEFTDNGYILPPSNDNKITFRTLNIKNVYIVVEKVYANNLTYFLQENSLKTRDEGGYYYGSGIHRVGVEIYNKKVDLKQKRNEWVVSELDLSEAFKKNPDGLFKIRLSYNKENMIDNIFLQKKNGHVDYGFLYRNNTVSKNVIRSHIGVIAKVDGENTTAYVTNLKTGKLVKDAKVNLISYQNQSLGEVVTKEDGKATFDSVKGFYLTAEKENSQAVLKFGESNNNTSIFETRGVSGDEEGLKGFIYTERGIYRPGDDIYLSLIVRNKDNTFPKDHPVTLQFFNPRGVKIKEITKKEGEDGFYTFNLKTEPTDPTGYYNVNIQAGGSRFYSNVRVESVVPYKLETEIEFDKKKYQPEDDKVKVDVTTKYLFGNPASEHKMKADVRIKPKNKKFKEFEEFIFGNELYQSTERNISVYNGSLDKNGKASFDINLTEEDKKFSVISGYLTVEALEKSGRPVPEVKGFEVENYHRYVGIKKPKSRYLRTGEESEFELLLLDKDGNVINNADLTYRIYVNRTYWWYHHERGKTHFKNDAETYKLKEDVVKTENEPVKVKFTTDSYGSVYIEVEDKLSGHIAGIFVNSYRWGDMAQSGDVNTIKLTTDKENYNPGDVAKVYFTAPYGNCLVSIEKGNKILSQYWKESTGGEMTVEIPVTEEMLPNVYTYITLIQPADQITNDRPLRLYGIVPIMVEKKDNKIDLTLEVPEQFEPKKKFTVTVNSNTKDGQVTVAVVDEGLLQITDYILKNPYYYFYAKQMLNVMTADNYNEVMSKWYGEILNRFSIGGGMMEARAAKMFAADENVIQLPINAKRFKPVSLFSGVVKLKDGKAVVEMEMPDYVGAVRVMVTAADKGKYGTTQERVAVKSDIMTVPSLPRVLSPEDEVKMPVSLFADKKVSGAAQVKISVEGPLEIVGESTATANFKDGGEVDLEFVLRGKKEVGIAKVKTEVIYNGKDYGTEIEIGVRPLGNHTTKLVDTIVKAGAEYTYTLPEGGMKGTTAYKVYASTKPRINFAERLGYLIRYPYGCLEQTTSAAFPQLYLPGYTEMDAEERAQIDRNINIAIRKLAKYKRYDGRLATWQGGSYISVWSNIYALHFLTEAKKRGYAIDEGIHQGLVNSILNEISSRYSKSDNYIKVYASYVLSLSNKHDLGLMNQLREDAYSMPISSRWLLAAAYKNVGYDEAADELTENAPVVVKEEEIFKKTYGSIVRDEAIILEAMTTLGMQNRAYKMFNKIAKKIGDNSWYSTQTTAFALKACSGYMEKFVEGGKTNFALQLLDGSEEQIKDKETYYFTSKTDDKGKVTLKNTGSKDLYVHFVWEGIPVIDTEPEEARNITVNYQIFNYDGVSLNANELEQGEKFYVFVRITPAIDVDDGYLSFMLPSGWELDQNFQEGSENMPQWARKLRTGHVRHKDMRDDRINFFYYGRKYNSLDFIFAVNAVSKGEFTLPPITAGDMYDYDIRYKGKSSRVKVK